MMEKSMVSLTAIETRIAIHMNGIMTNMIAVGRDLNDAKESGLIAHGEWESWVLKNTGFSVRQAQRLMQAARNVPAGSAMEQLEVSKVTLLLALPEEQRETVAEEAVKGKVSVKELKARIRELTDADAEQRAKLDRVTRHNEVLRQHLQMKQAELEKLQEAPARVETVTVEVESAASRERIAALQAQVGELEEYAAQLSDEKKELQMAARNARMGSGESVSATQVSDVLRSIEQFIGAASIIGQMGVQLGRMKPGERGEVEAHIRMVRDWLRTAEAAMNVVEVL